MVSHPTLHRHELAKGIYATFLYPTARLPPLFDAVVVITGGWCVEKKQRNIHTEGTTSHGEDKKEKKRKKKEVPSIELASFDWIV